MPKVALNIPTLIGGVSTQPPETRLATQLETATNVLCTVTRGTERRPGTQLVLSGDTSDGSLEVTNPTHNKLVHWIDRDDDEKFVMLIDHQNSSPYRIEIFDLDGTKQTVVDNNQIAGGTPTTDTMTSGVNDSRFDIRAFTVADTTFILNTKRTMYRIEGTEGNYQYGGTSVREAANAHNVAGYTEADHPPTASGEYWFFSVDEPGFPAGFYISQNHTGAGPWYARVPSEYKYSTFNEDSLPFKAVYNGSQFDINQIVWDVRYSGDDVTNPGPSIAGTQGNSPTFTVQTAGSPINDLLIHRNRLFFGADNKLVSSQAGDLYNLWIDSIYTLTDADPIDLFLPGISVNSIDFFVPFSNSLLITTKGEQQYELRSEGVLGPDTASLVQSTNYPPPTTRPVVLGSQAYFCTQNNRYTALWEYLNSTNTVPAAATEVSSHCQGYLPAPIRFVAASPQNDIIFMVSTLAGEENRIYIYSMFWSGDQKVQSSLYKWDLDDSIEIIGLKVYNDMLYLCIRRDDLIWIEKVSIVAPANDADDDGTLGFAVRLDSRLNLTGVYDAGTNTTTWTVPFVDLTYDRIVLGGGWGDRKGQVIVPNSVTEDTGTTLLTFFGDWSDYDVWIGRTYETRLDLSPQFVRDQNNQVIMGNLQLKHMVVHHDATAYYKVYVEPEGREEQVFSFAARQPGSFTLGPPTTLETGTFMCPVFGNARSTSISIRSDAVTPVAITRISMTGNFIPAKRSLASN